MRIGVGLRRELKKGLTTLLKENVEIFTWDATNMIGVPRKIMENKLNVKATSKPIQQKKGTIKR